MAITVGSSMTGAAVAAIAALTANICLAQSLQRLPSPPDARVYFETPTQGERVFSPFVVRAGLHGMGVAPAATAVPSTGHHHLLIDTKPAPFDVPLPVTNDIIHLSNGETEIKVSLSPGWHTLQLVFADGNHLNFNPPVMSKPIHIYVRRR